MTNVRFGSDTVRAISTHQTSSATNPLRLYTKEWKLWKQLWFNYIAVAANLAAREEQYQEALFLCTIGKEALEVYNAFEYEADQEPGKITTIISKFDEYFTGDINETNERFKLNQRRGQGMNESFNSYLTELRNMLKTAISAPASLTLFPATESYLELKTTIPGSDCYRKEA